MERNDSEILRNDMEVRLAGAGKELKHLLNINKLRRPEARVSTLMSCETEDGGLLVVNGSAHTMKEHFTALFTERPEFRAVVQEVLDSMFKIDCRR